MAISESIGADDIAADPGGDDAPAWTGFAAARLASEFCQSWLALQCRLIPATSAGLLLLEEADGSFAPAARWTLAGADVATLVAAATRALHGRRGVVERTETGDAHVAYPVDVRGRIWGVVVVAVAARPQAALQDALRQLHWGAGWIETLFHRHQAEEDARQLATARLALEMVAVTAAARGLAAAAQALAGELATQLACRRVAIGAVRGGAVRLLALSHAAIVSAKQGLSDSVVAAMEEAVDQGGTVAHPAIPGADRHVAVAHRDHAAATRMSAVLSVVLTHDGATTGAITLERDDANPFAPQTVALCEAVAEIVGPVFALHRDLDRVVTGRAPRALGAALRAVFGPRHPTWKLVALAVAGVCAWLSVATGTFWISGKATIEGVVQRAAVAPFDGYVATAPRRAGDLVEEGEVLATIDTREVELDALRYESQRDQARLKQQDAEGKHDRAEAAVLGATAAEAEAQLALARDKLARARLTAPFRGLVVSGDLSQQLGSPVERGKTLFEIAPLDSYRIIVQVDEREVTRIRPGQAGHLVLNGLSAEALGFAVVKTIPVSVAADGRNSFRVEGLLTSTDRRLRPGMEGIGKIDGGRESLVWIWAHPIADWIRLTLWKWLP